MKKFSLLSTPLTVASLTLGAVGYLGSATPLAAADWPHFRGPEYDGKSTEKVLKTWPQEGPKVMWKIPMGLGFSAITVSLAPRLRIAWPGDPGPWPG